MKAARVNMVYDWHSNIKEAIDETLRVLIFTPPHPILIIKRLCRFVGLWTKDKGQETDTLLDLQWWLFVCGRVIEAMATKTTGRREGIYAVSTRGNNSRI